VTPERPPKLGESVARRIEVDIRQRGWPIGEQLGTEATLAQQYGVSRAVVREAVRILEHQMVVSSRRGLGGGVVVTRPDIAAVVPVVGVYLDVEGVSPATMFEARSAIELSTLELAVDRVDEGGATRLRQALAAEKAQLAEPEALVLSHDLHHLIAELSGNAALRLFVTVLTRLTSEHSRDRLAAMDDTRVGEIGAEICRAHVKIVEAVLHKDAALAQRRMVSHLRAVTKWVS
jgi:DNA-binding FadR family transcriptional regulator